MNNNEMLAALDAAGDAIREATETALRITGEDFTIRFRPADDLIPRDEFMVTMECPGVPFGIVKTGATASVALLKAMAARSDQLKVAA